MGMFAQSAAEAARLDAPRRYAGMRERGTRNLLILSVLAVAGYFGVTKITDSYLLRQKWQPLTADVSGLTVVGTLDSRGEYDRNLFRIKHLNQSTRIELTDFGLRTIFDSETPALEQKSADAVTHALQLDNATGYAMLAPFVRVGVARTLGKQNAAQLAAPQTPVTDPKSKQNVPLQALLDRYGNEVKLKEEMDDAKKDNSGGSASGRDTDEGITIPGDILATTCPVVLTSKLFTDAQVIPQPESFLTDKTYSVRLWLNREGRSRFYQWSRSHVNESVAFVLNGEVMAAARVTQPLDVNWWDVTNIRDEQAANTLVKWVQEHK